MGRPRIQTFTNPIRHRIVREGISNLKIFVIALFLVPDLRVGDTDAPIFIINLEKLNVMGLIGLP